jgi:hypothetical protein
LLKGHYLGFTDPDADLANQAGLDAQGDDANKALDDDDILALPTLMQGKEVAFTRFVSGKGGYLQSWIDFDGNGRFDNDEQVAINLQDNGKGDDAIANDGTIIFRTAVPCKATTKPTYMRFRWSTEKNLDSKTAASDGEVEDYAITIQSGDQLMLSSLEMLNADQYAE